MASSVKEGVLLGLGNPLLDITVVADQAFLDKYKLEANNAIMADDSYAPMFSEMVAKFKPTYGAGGATQNSIRVAQWLLQREHATSYFGGVGDDENAKILLKCAQAAGVNTRYCTDNKLPTGVCASVITGENRSLVAHLGAADFFTHMFMEEPENWQLVEKADMFYIGGFVFPVCNQAIFDLAQHACDNNKTLAMNLSAPFLCKYFADTSQERWDIMPYIDILFGNEVEAATFCKLRGIEATTVEEMAVATSNLPKKNTSRGRMVVFTQGKDPTIIAKDGKAMVFPINPVSKDQIRDTNGCGDAFVGGFLSQLVQGKPVEECVRCGNYAAKTVIQHWGCSFPQTPDFK